MTATTHQMVALVAALWLLTLYPVALGPTLGTLAVIAVMLGALTPDLDQPTANLWRRMLGANVVGNIFQFFSGGHRHLTHSLIGIALIGWLLQWGIDHLVHPAYVEASMKLWAAFMIGYISHPIADTLTDMGVPWLWPLKFNFKIPPGPEEVRVTTDSIVEQVIVRGGLIAIAVILLIDHWPVAIRLFQ